MTYFRVWTTNVGFHTFETQVDLFLACDEDAAKYMWIERFGIEDHHKSMSIPEYMKHKLLADPATFEQIARHILESKAKKII